MTKAEIERIQTRLAELGLYAGRIDGDAGPMTNRALLDYANWTMFTEASDTARTELEVPAVTLRTNAAGIALMHDFEKLRLNAYNTDGAGVWTIGWGHTSAAGPPKVVPGMTITKEEADRIFARDVDMFEDGVERLLTREPTPNQFAAMVSLAFNIGMSNFAGSSIIRYFNAGNFAEAANRFLLWNKAQGKVLDGLVRRRKAERELFLR